MEPVTVTDVLAGPELGLRVAAGVVTVNGVDAVLAPLLADIVCAPEAELGILIVAEKAPVAVEVTVTGVVG